MLRLLRAGLAASLLLAVGSQLARADEVQTIKAAAQQRVNQLAPRVPIERVTLGSIVGDWATIIFFPPPDVTDPGIVIVQRQGGQWQAVAGPGTAFPPESVPGMPENLFWRNPYTGALAEEAIAGIPCKQAASSAAVTLQVPCDATTVAAGNALTVTLASGQELQFTRLGLASGPFDEWAYARAQQDAAPLALPDGSSPIQAVRFYLVGHTAVLQVDLSGGDSVLRWFFLQTAPDAAIVRLVARVAPPANDPTLDRLQAALALALATLQPTEDTAGWSIAGMLYDDPAQPIAVQAGQQFTLALAANATTGYSWQLVSPPDPSVVVLVTSRYEPPATPRPGAGGRQLLTFQAVGPGRVSLTLAYQRPWEQGVPPARTAQFQVTVQ
ncbi:MAG: protease inhibitor I42 family protein [Chloroflexi bacterium]|nr:protease inhibitor I42 family protein [Chloroflexota bacterium]